MGADSAALRLLLDRHVLSELAGHTHRELPGACAGIGLPALPEEGTKRERLEASLAALPDAEVPAVARNALVHRRLPPDVRNAIQDVLWVGEGAIPVLKSVRREVARGFDLEELVRSGCRLWELLDRLWVLSDPMDLFRSAGHGLGARIEQHVLRNPGDWSAEELFDRLGAFEAPDARFTRFLEGLVSGDVVPDEARQRAVAAGMNRHLAAAGAELREVGSEDGYPVFALVSTRSGRGRPKNLIFASANKPDIRFRDAIDNDIEIVGNTGDVLVYDRPIGADGIHWSDLRAWWAHTHPESGDEAATKAALYARLRKSVDDAKSPPQLLLFDLYHDIVGATTADFPALLPEVWLHWDPKTVHARGVDALLRFRMDFLLLLPRGRRVVLEVDGRHHYAVGDRADPATYAATMRADRDLKLAGYEVFRFGTHDLRNPRQAGETVRRFFEDLFTAFGVTP